MFSLLKQLNISSYITRKSSLLKHLAIIAINVEAQLKAKNINLFISKDNNRHNN